MSEITIPSPALTLPEQLVIGGPEVVMEAAHAINDSIPAGDAIVKAMMNRCGVDSTANLLRSLSGHGLAIRQFYNLPEGGQPGCELIRQYNFEQAYGRPSDADLARASELIAELEPNQVFGRVCAERARRIGHYSLILLAPRIVPVTGVVIRSR